MGSLLVVMLLQSVKQRSCGCALEHGESSGSNLLQSRNRSCGCALEHGESSGSNLLQSRNRSCGCALEHGESSGSSLLCYEWCIVRHLCVGGKVCTRSLQSVLHSFGGFGGCQFTPPS